MKKMMIALTLCFMAGWASAAADLRVFQSTAGAAWPRLEAQLTESGKITPEGVIDSGTIAGIAVQVAIERGVLKDPTDEERQAYGLAFLVHNGIGATIHRDQFRAIGADADPNKGFRLPVLQAGAQPVAVATARAASAPTPTVVTAVTTVPTDALATEIAALRQQLSEQKAETAAAILRLTGDAQAAARQRADQLAVLDKKLQDETKKIAERVSAGEELRSGERAALTTTFREINTKLKNQADATTALKDSLFIRFGDWIWVGLVVVLFAIGAAAFTALSRTRETKLKEVTTKFVGDAVSAATAPILARATSAETAAVGASGVANTAQAGVNLLKQEVEALAEQIPVFNLDGLPYYKGGREGVDQACAALAEGETHQVLVSDNGRWAKVSVRKNDGKFYILSGVLNQRPDRAVRSPALIIASASRENRLVFNSSGVSNATMPSATATV